MDLDSAPVDAAPCCRFALLVDELLALCIGRGALRSLPHVALVSRHWRDAARRAFASQLRWRRDVRCAPLPLSVPAVPESRTVSHIYKSGFNIAFLRGGDLVAQIVDPRDAAVRAVRFGGDAVARDAGDAGAAASELPRREFADHGPFNAGVGGVVGYRRRGAPSGMSFFPLTTNGGEDPSASVRVAAGEWQNVLHAGDVVFLLRAGDWWSDDRITADVLDTDTGGIAEVDVTPMRDALRLALDRIRDRPARGAVSAADGHFIFHLSSERGCKAAGSLRLPRISPEGIVATDAAVVFARCWPIDHPISEMGERNETPCGEYLMLWTEARQEFGGRINMLVVVLLCARAPERRPRPSVLALPRPLRGCRQQSNAAKIIERGLRRARRRTGDAPERKLVVPALAGDEPRGNVIADFGGVFGGGFAAITYAPASGVVAACSKPWRGLPPPVVVVWDWTSSACLRALFLDPQAARATTLGQTLRYHVGARVEYLRRAGIFSMESRGDAAAGTWT